MRNEKGQFVKGPRPEIAGVLNPAWKGGRREHEHGGYVRVRVNGTYQLEHRLVMEHHIGRALESSEHVHHVNGDKQDNRIENLILTTVVEHMHHHRDRVQHPCSICGVPMERVRSATSPYATCSAECRSESVRRRKPWEARWGSPAVEYVPDLR